MENKDIIDIENGRLHVLEDQVLRGNLFTHTSIGNQANRINEVESFVFGLIDVLIEKGNINEEEIKEATARIRQEMVEKGEIAHAGVQLRMDSEKDKLFTPVNCEERMPICNAICCKLTFPLSAEEVEAGNVKWDLGQPYHIRHKKSGFCTHLNEQKGCCSVYDNRPKVCSKYSCADDKRIWKDFEKMELNTEWIEKNLKERKMVLQRATMVLQ
ncbi:Fe-S-cluster containining protein [Kordia periserrulae]|uniref:Fe-S-cluster containining protein n=1 Tax=Kordia periserrulae TaxID=701523 RepID=A0A2T6BZV9_9FLAO|nr:YkgJ family cysteine cluster protein [Kordia periserrulae]PTX61609.1 Fe-S-cluster containining protein [Kordia periserrulae]